MDLKTRKDIIAALIDVGRTDLANTIAAAKWPNKEIEKMAGNYRGSFFYTDDDRKGNYLVSVQMIKSADAKRLMNDVRRMIKKNGWEDWLADGIWIEDYKKNKASEKIGERHGMTGDEITKDHRILYVSFLPDHAINEMEKQKKEDAADQQWNDFVRENEGFPPGTNVPHNF